MLGSVLGTVRNQFVSEIGDWNSGQLLSPFLNVVLTSLGFALWRVTGGVTYIKTYMNSSSSI